MPLPPAQAQSTGDGLTVVDYRARTLASSPAGPDGICQVTFEPVPPGLFWLVDRMVVSCTSNVQTVVRVFTAGQLVNATPAGNLDVDDANSPILVDSSTELDVAWTGAAEGAIATARVQYRVMRRS